MTAIRIISGKSGKRQIAAGALALVLGLSGLMASDTAFAHGGRIRFGVGVTIGAPLFWPGWYPGPHYYYPPYPPAVVVIPAAPAAPTVYVERERVEQAPERQEPASPSNWWYFCRDANAYYPYVRHCPAGWERVNPQPPAG